MNILIVDDQRSARRVLSAMLQPQEDIELREAASLDEARRIFSAERIDVALIDIRLSDDPRNRDGLALVDDARRHGAIPIVVTASQELNEIRTAMKNGAQDYILKDEISEELVLPIIEGLQRRQRLEDEVVVLRARSAGDVPLGLVGASPAMAKLRESVRRVAASTRPALVIGPTGSGKELVVRALHLLGAHPDEPLLDLNCGAIPEALVESQLFGHEKGAFTGADRRQAGYFTAVRSGTLFLDEIAELPLGLQAKLLRVLETGRFRPVGSTEEQRFKGRLVAATHADLAERVREGRFRQDLMYRLDVLPIAVPPLDERREDIPALVDHFAREQTRALKFTPEALSLLTARPWPGNVRELRNLVERLAVFAPTEQIDAAALESVVPGGGRVGDGGAPAVVAAMARELLRMPIGNKLDAIEEALVHEALRLADGNKSGAARLLGVHRKVVERRLDRLGASDGDE